MYSKHILLNPLSVRKDSRVDVWNALCTRQSPRDDSSHLASLFVHQSSARIALASTFSGTSECAEILPELHWRYVLVKVSDNALYIGHGLHV